jgi:hypothetical protein
MRFAYVTPRGLFLAAIEDLHMATDSRVVVEGPV